MEVWGSDRHSDRATRGLSILFILGKRQKFRQIIKYTGDPKFIYFPGPKLEQLSPQQQKGIGQCDFFFLTEALHRVAGWLLHLTFFTIINLVEIRLLSEQCELPPSKQLDNQVGESLLSEAQPPLEVDYFFKIFLSQAKSISSIFFFLALVCPKDNWRLYMNRFGKN